MDKVAILTGDVVSRVYVVAIRKISVSNSINIATIIGTGVSDTCKQAKNLSNALHLFKFNFIIFLLLLII